MKTVLLITIMAFSISLRAQKTSNNYTSFQHTITTDASKESIWEIWTDVNNWKSWDTGLSDAILNGEFKQGNKGRITSLEGRKTKFKIVSLEEGEHYTIRTKLPLGSLYIKRSFNRENDQLSFTHRVWFQGISGGFFARVFGKKFSQMLPEVMDNINQIALK